MFNHYKPMETACPTRVMDRVAAVPGLWCSELQPVLALRVGHGTVVLVIVVHFWGPLQHHLRFSIRGLILPWISYIYIHIIYIRLIIKDIIRCFLHVVAFWHDRTPCWDTSIDHPLSEVAQAVATLRRWQPHHGCPRRRKVPWAPSRPGALAENCSCLAQQISTDQQIKHDETWWNYVKRSTYICWNMITRTIWDIWTYLKIRFNSAAIKASFLKGRKMPWVSRKIFFQQH